MESFVRVVVDDRKAVCDPTQTEQWCITDEEIKDQQEELTNLSPPERDLKLSEWVAEQSCLACRTFGSPWLASPVLVRDLLVDESVWFDQYQVRNGVAIDRDTETASEGKLYDYEVIPSGTRFQFRLLAENAEPWSLGMLFVGLRAFQDGQVAIGGSKSRGLGWIKLDLEKPKFFSLNGENGDARIEKLFGFLDGKGFEDVGPDKVKEWVDAFREELARRAKEVRA
jgi:CRISPR-associated RAMP protein (TIGR02581 family)